MGGLILVRSVISDESQADHGYQDQRHPLLMEIGTSFVKQVSVKAGNINELGFMT